MLRLFRHSRFRAASVRTARPKRRARFTKAANSATSLSHGFGAAFDNPDLIVAVVVGDGEAETGPLATSWHSNKFLNPIRDGAVLPVLHLNGYKIANPTILARIPREELEALLTGYGYKPYFVEGTIPSHASADGRDARTLHRRDPRDPGTPARRATTRRDRAGR